MTFPQAALRYGAGRVWRQRQLPLVAPYLPAYLPTYLSTPRSGTEFSFQDIVAIAVKGAAQSLACMYSRSGVQAGSQVTGKVSAVVRRKLSTRLQAAEHAGMVTS